MLCLEWQWSNFEVFVITCFAFRQQNKIFWDISVLRALFFRWPNTLFDIIFITIFVFVMTKHPFRYYLCYNLCLCDDQTPFSILSLLQSLSLWWPNTLFDIIFITIFVFVMTKHPFRYYLYYNLCFSDDQTPFLILSLLQSLSLWWPNTLFDIIFVTIFVFVMTKHSFRYYLYYNLCLCDDQTLFSILSLLQSLSLWWPNTLFDIIFITIFVFVMTKHSFSILSLLQSLSLWWPNTLFDIIFITIFVFPMTKHAFWYYLYYNLCLCDDQTPFSILSLLQSLSLWWPNTLFDIIFITIFVFVMTKHSFRYYLYYNLCLCDDQTLFSILSLLQSLSLWWPNTLFRYYLYYNLCLCDDQTLFSILSLLQSLSLWWPNTLFDIIFVTVFVFVMTKHSFRYYLYYNLCLCDDQTLFFDIIFITIFVFVMTKHSFWYYLYYNLCLCDDQTLFSILSLLQSLSLWWPNTLFRCYLYYNICVSDDQTPFLILSLLQALPLWWPNTLFNIIFIIIFAFVMTKHPFRYYLCYNLCLCDDQTLFFDVIFITIFVFLLTKHSFRYYLYYNLCISDDQTPFLILSLLQALPLWWPNTLFDIIFITSFVFVMTKHSFQYYIYYNLCLSTTKQFVRYFCHVLRFMILYRPILTTNIIMIPLSFSDAKHSTYTVHRNRC